jgi:hypothetical protein
LPLRHEPFGMRAAGPRAGRTGRMRKAQIKNRPIGAASEIIYVYTLSRPAAKSSVKSPGSSSPTDIRI